MVHWTNHALQRVAERSLDLATLRRAADAAHAAGFGASGKTIVTCGRTAIVLSHSTVITVYPLTPGGTRRRHKNKGKKGK